MSNVSLAKRTLPIIFSLDFESLLLNYPSEHISISDDIELLAKRGLWLLEELEDVHDFQHIELLKQLIVYSNQYLEINDDSPKQWFINLDEDLLDEIELLILTHGEDLQELGLTSSTIGNIVVLLVTANFVFSGPLSPVRQTIS